MRRRSLSKPILSRPRWKEIELIKQNRQIKTIIKAGFILIVTVVFLLGVGEVWKSWRETLWDNQRTFYLAVAQGETFWLVKVDKKQQGVVVVKIPGNTLMMTARGFGEYPAKSIYKLGEMEKIPGIILVKESLTWTFGIPVEGILRFSKDTPELNLKMALAKNFLGLGQTNLTRWDSWRLFWFFNRLRLDQMEIFSLTDIPGTETKVRPDGVRVLTLDTERLDGWLLAHFANSELVNEPFSWQVINTTSNSGLAAQVGRILRNTGTQVVQLTEGPAQSSKIYVDKTVNSQAVKSFSQFWQIPLDQPKPNLASSGEVTLVLGHDFWQRCCQH